MKVLQSAPPVNSSASSKRVRGRDTYLTVVDSINNILSDRVVLDSLHRGLCSYRRWLEGWSRGVVCGCGKAADKNYDAPALAPPPSRQGQVMDQATHLTAQDRGLRVLDSGTTVCLASGD